MPPSLRNRELDMKFPEPPWPVAAASPWIVINRNCCCLAHRTTQTGAWTDNRRLAISRCDRLNASARYQTAFSSISEEKPMWYFTSPVPKVCYILPQLVEQIAVLPSTLLARIQTAASAINTSSQVQLLPASGSSLSIKSGRTSAKPSPRNLAPVALRSPAAVSSLRAFSLRSKALGQLRFNALLDPAFSSVN